MVLLLVPLPLPSQGTFIYKVTETTTSSMTLSHKTLISAVVRPQIHVISTIKYCTIKNTPVSPPTNHQNACWKSTASESHANSSLRSTWPSDFDKTGHTAFYLLSEQAVKETSTHSLSSLMANFIILSVAINFITPTGSCKVTSCFSMEPSTSILACWTC